MDNIREKLVELLNRVQDSGEKRVMVNPSTIDLYTVSNEQIADHLIANNVTVQEWIPVTERLPDDNDRVIAFRPNEPETSAYKYCVMWGWSIKTSLKHRGITHWMPLPTPPKGE